MRDLSLLTGNRTVLVCGVLAATLISIMGLPPFLNPWLATALALGALLVPGWLVLRLLDPEPLFSRAVTLPTAFVLGIGLLSPFALLVVGLRLPLAVLGYLAAAITLGLGGLVWFREAHQATTPIQPPPVLEPISRPLLLAVAGTAGAVFYLYLITMSTWSSGDTWYLRYISAYMAGAYGNVDFNLRASWWILQAWQNQITSLTPLDAFSFYLPPFLILLSILGSYALARELFERHNPALLAVLVQLVFFVSSIGSHDWLGRGFFDRIIEDKFLIWLVLLPVMLLLALRYIRTGQSRLLWGLGLSYNALALVHPMGLVQGAVAVGSLGVVHLLLERRTEMLKRVLLLGGLLALLVVVPLLQRSTIWGRQSGEDIRESRAFNYALATGGNTSLASLNHTRLWVFSALEDNYIAHPHLIAHPMVLLAILLTPLLLLDLQRSLAVQFLFSNMVATLILLYTPGLTPLLGRLITPWMIYRLSYGLPVSFVITLFLCKLFNKIEQTRLLGQRRRWLPVLPLLAILLAVMLLQNYISDSLGFLQARKEMTIPSLEKELLAHLSQIATPGSVVMAKKDSINVYAPAFAPVQALISNTGGPPAAIAAIDRFYRSQMVSDSLLAILQQWNIQYVIIERNHQLAFQFARLPSHFRQRYQNEMYELYELLPIPEPDPVITGNTCFVQGEWDKAIGAYMQALALDPAHPLAHFGLGQVYQVMGRTQEAKAAYSQSIIVQPDFVPALLAIAELYLKEGKVAEADTAYQTAIQLRPHYQPAIEALGDLYLKEGWIDKAVEQYRQAVEFLPGNNSYHSALAHLFQAKGLSKEAEAEYNRVITLNSLPGRVADAEFAIMGIHNRIANIRLEQLVNANLGLATIYQAEHKYDQVISIYQQVIAIAPDEAKAYRNLSSLYLAREDPQQVISLYQEAARRNLNPAWPHLELGQLYLAQTASH